MRRLLTLAPATAILVLAGCFGENHYEKQADQVTKAVIANDMRPVEGQFNAIVRPNLTNRAKVGELSDELNRLGPIKSIKETTPKDAPAGQHTFAVEFAKATWDEEIRLDSDGKIAAFYVHPPKSGATQ